jgi:23S rRNA (cytidine1920-2'-O)/16S rRNA (cytidine1409-2'-O)-methyltransferase
VAVVKQRLDARLVELGLCDSRQQAQRVIRAGEVQVNHQLIDKPGTAIPLDAVVQVKQKSAYVSRGGDKLAKALTAFDLQVSGRIGLDGGISTGGFTDCLLQAGAAKMYGVDVGYGQVAWRLRQDPRLVLRERTNLRHLQPEDLYPEGRIEADLGVIDVSFISLDKVLPALWRLLIPPREVVLLVKPQFEVGREKVGKKGVVRDLGDQANAIAAVLTAAQTLGWTYRGLTWSPLVGPAGNIEYLLWLGQTDGSTPPTLAEIKTLTAAAKVALTKPAPEQPALDQPISE